MTHRYSHTPLTTAAEAPVIALHGSAADGRQWRALAQAFSARHRVLCPDLPGYGVTPDTARAGHDPFGRIGLARETAGLVARIETLGCPVHLVGHSYGGALALRIALDRPDLVASLALYEPAAWQVLWLDAAVEDDGHFLRIFGLADSLQEALDRGHAAAGMARFVDFWSRPGAWAAMAPDRQARLAGKARRLRKDFAAIAAERWGPAALARLPMPTLIMAGTETVPAARRVAERIADAMPTAQLALLPGAGHMAPVETPDAVNRLIAAHLTAGLAQAPALPTPPALAA